MPLSMGSAVSAHSNVIRRAAWSHYGFVVGQEGDSFILAFRDACDAVAFCLQVGRGLWVGLGLMRSTETDTTYREGWVCRGHANTRGCCGWVGRCMSGVCV